MKYIGGIYHNRDHAGDPNGQPPFVPVPAKEQREALAFLANKIWAPDVVQIPAALLNKLQFERFRDFERRLSRASRLDYPLHDAVLNVQGEILNDLYDPIKLNRLLDMELTYPDPNDRFTMVDLFVGIRDSIWSELDAGLSINSFRRNLQREHIKHLVRMALRPQKGTPGDAVALSRADLVHLRAGIDRALSRALDNVTRAHLDETRNRIQQVLEAEVERTLVEPPSTNTQ